MSGKNAPNYWAVIPAAIRYDRDLSPNAKLLYAEISALCDQHGYCFATNGYFAGNFGLSVKSIQRLVKTLADEGHIFVDVIRNAKTQEVEERRIYAGVNPAGQLPPPSPQNCGDPSPQNCGGPSPQNCGVEQSNRFNNTPYIPQRGCGVRKRKTPRNAPDWKPERFGGFWQFYPQKGRKNRQAAMDAWDKLRPDDRLVDTIALALVKLKGTDDWKRGIGIPHASTFLNQSRWLDAAELDEPSEADGGWAPDEEVL